jgi:hypothetical protein
MSGDGDNTFLKIFEAIVKPIVERFGGPLSRLIWRRRLAKLTLEVDAVEDLGLKNAFHIISTREGGQIFMIDLVAKKAFLRSSFSWKICDPSDIMKIELKSHPQETIHVWVNDPLCPYYRLAVSSTHGNKDLLRAVGLLHILKYRGSPAARFER